MTKDNIVLLGFMASGKSHVGALVAKKLGFSFYDTDALIEEEQGMSIKNIFSQKSEGYFRKLESQAINKLLGSKKSVIVVGGGAPMFFDNVQMLKSMGHNFYLDVGFNVISRRLKNSDKRPLGQANTPEDLSKLKELYTFRRPIYAQLGSAIDTSDESKSQTCDEIIKRFHALNDLARCKRVNIEHPHHRYQIYLSELANIPNILLSLGLLEHRPLLITSDHLAEKLRGPIDCLKDHLKNLAVIAIKDGEEHKNLSTINDIHKQMFEHKLTRKTVVLALGGGNVGDVAGFASAIYLRGVPFIQIPTTLLAMVDSSIGGKTGVDLEIGKNLIGSFYAPKAVLIDKNFLSSLPQEEMSGGMAEIIKHAIIADPRLFHDLKHTFDHTYIERALKVKADIVFSDPYEHNIRAHLNLGHTFAHAIEKVSHYRIKHGFAVAIGLVLATQMAKKLAVLEENILPDLLTLLEKYGLPTKLPKEVNFLEMVSAMKHDKKRDNFGLKLILPQKLGQVVIKAVDEEDLLSLKASAF